MQIEVPAFADCDFTDTYLMPMKFKIYTIKMMESQKPKKDQISIEFLMKKNIWMINQMFIGIQNAL